MSIKILTFSTLYPDSTRPTHGIFVENRLRHLLSHSDIQSRVVAPVPWFPFGGTTFGEYARFAKVPAHEVRHGIEVVHPRYPLIPKIGMTVAPWLMAFAVKKTLRKIMADDYNFDLIDAHYFYPDGVAATILGKAIGKPVVITARGTDLNLIPKYFFPRKMIKWAATNAAAVITVSVSLKDILVSLGLTQAHITVLRNGVDLIQFRPPSDRESLRAELGLRDKILLSVGNLVPLKGQENIIRSLQFLPDTTLLIAGSGPEKKTLENVASTIGVSNRVHFLGTVDHEQLPKFYSAADALVIASSREGWPNVLLESLACGTPVISTKTGSAPELLSDPEAGLLMDTAEAKTIAQTCEKLWARKQNREATRGYAEQFSWDETSLGQLRVFENVLKDGRSAGVSPSPVLQKSA